MAFMGALLTGGSIDKETTPTRASQSHVVKNSSSDAGSTLGGVQGVADRAVESRAGITLEGLGGVEVEARDAGACSVVGVVDQSSLGIAVDADWRVVLDIQASVGGTTGWAAARRGVICISVLIESQVSPEVLVLIDGSHVGDSNDSIGSGRVGVEALNNLYHCVASRSTSHEGVFVEDEPVNC